MSMTPRDLAKFEKLWQLIKDWQSHRILWNPSVVESPVLMTLIKAIEKLEAITLFSVLCDLGEQGVTPEQRECLRRIGMLEIFDSLIAELGKK